MYPKKKEVVCQGLEPAPDLIEILMSTYLRLRYPTVPVFLSSLPKRGLKYLSFLKFVLDFLVVDSLCLYFYSFKNLWLDMKSLCSVSNSTVINILSSRFLFFKKNARRKKKQLSIAFREHRIRQIGDPSMKYPREYTLEKSLPPMSHISVFLQLIQ